tara:strand:- start:734 stop:1465 length:732 start_codon:yes stop_codon:yes gene_type:complete
MFTLGIPNRQKRRAIDYLTRQWLDFEEHPSEDGFIEVRFPDMDEDSFRDISNQLKQQGVTLIGVDTQLTERNIMKLTDLIKENNISGMEPTDANLMSVLKNILRRWSTTQYADEKQRSDDFFLDIKELIEDFEETEVAGYPLQHQNVALREAKFKSIVQNQIKNIIKEDNFDSKLSNLMGKDDFEKATNPKLAKLISNAIQSIDSDLSYMDFSDAITEVISDEFGAHNVKPFLQHLTQNLSQI